MNSLYNLLILGLLQLIISINIKYITYNLITKQLFILH